MSKMVLKTYAQVNHDRTILRWGLFTVLFPLFIVFSLLAGYVVNVYVANANAVKVYEKNAAVFQEGKPVDHREIGETLIATEFLEENVFATPWVVHYNRGSLMVLDGSYEDGIKELTKALSKVPEAKDAKCSVVNNLAVGWELLGDRYKEEGNTGRAEASYEEGLKIIEQNKDCLPPEQDGDKDGDKQKDEPENDKGEPLTASEKVEETGNRLQDKKEQVAPDGGEHEKDGETGEQDPSEKVETPGDDAVKKIREQLEQSQKDKASNDNGANPNQNGDGGPTGGYGKPW